MGHELPGIEVGSPTLEDIYIELTGSSDGLPVESHAS
jgi:hypothetical protein